ncbi:type III polyketide synthase [Streptomyces argenteolus]|uniref:Type III polyketide synthase n=1 Tax=Streptomyces argenteolus TaxID=67274 RepID=A0ABW6X6X5_9ACTN
MSRIVAVHGVLPPHRHSQREVTDMVARTCLPQGSDRRVLDRIHGNAGVRSRNTVLPLEGYAGPHDFGTSNDVFIRAAVDLGAEAVRGALRKAGLLPTDVDLLMFTSVTGIAAPSVDARLVGRLGLRPDVKRLPVFGLGCVAGAAGVARLHDYLLGHPGQVAVLLSVELCSLTFQRDDATPANLVATALFGDGAAAAVLVGGEHPSRAGGPEVLDTRSRLYPDTGHVMGWDIRSSGFTVVLDPAVPDVVRRYLAEDVTAFLEPHGLKPKDIARWVCHPGGPKVLEAVTDALDLPGSALDVTRRSLAETGNLSSSSVLHVLRDTMEQRGPDPGSPGLLMAMGPGFCCELVLLRW